MASQLSDRVDELRAIVDADRLPEIDELRRFKHQIIGNVDRKARFVELDGAELLCKVIDLAVEIPQWSDCDDTLHIELATEAMVILTSLCQPRVDSLLKLVGIVPACVLGTVSKIVHSFKTFALIESSLKCIRNLYISLKMVSSSAIVFNPAPLPCCAPLSSKQLRELSSEGASFQIAIDAAWDAYFDQENIFLMLSLLCTFTFGRISAATGSWSRLARQQSESAAGTICQTIAEMSRGGDDMVSVASVGRRICKEHDCMLLYMLMTMTLARSPQVLRSAYQLIGAIAPHAEPDIMALLSKSAADIRDQEPSVQIAMAYCHVNYSVMMPDWDKRGYAAEDRNDVLPLLLSLFDKEPQIALSACALLTTLVTDCESAQELACKLDAFSQLDRLLETTQLPGGYSDSAERRQMRAQLRQHGLLAVAALCLTRDDLRRQMVETKILPKIVASLKHEHAPVRAAACQCARAISRSVSLLRTCLLQAGAALPLVDLLRNEDEDEPVKIAATAAICNLLPDFSPMKELLIANDILPKLVVFVDSPNVLLRQYALAALKNGVYWAEHDLKKLVSTTLGWQRLLELFDDCETTIQVHALSLLRNIACTRVEDVEMALQGMGPEACFDMLNRKLCSKQSEVTLQAVYVLLNIATGDVRHKQEIMDRPDLLKSLLATLWHESPDIRIAALWCIINLTPSERKGAYEVARKFAAQGVGSRLEKLKEDSCYDVSERAADILDTFQWAGFAQ
ncbi:uncharacterized protein L969DRAFT_84223 [Mixia osmundae IAM 14324]|uniref:Uncharacterized protein n=1 Tax=Mixia osmundae (strain CBS 9802 / IAM 14324 / JCM 22182 / KY 12970) TaxID=764103 RepID=G7E875_MIXOS|nr:uncharacterized protein L969DRAFT_84223 [Mixia osmundae IAM 14324]KEI42373.1 hypothetical protein L969DRAFT_84223 [Mixia osmundae IAM 14324]GAA99035.1 hypothetical protein E5Q_05724 [Mixia osmundae IAM 14324]